MQRRSLKKYLTVKLKRIRISENAASEIEDKLFIQIFYTITTLSRHTHSYWILL